ncbi:MAG: efflux RND transporter periplasmic adaptor subunit [Planctomycetota bacterium]|nr:efflux RND transporter periplasmic adaptor subunit [Planctomycetota bacterium]
MQSKRTAWFVGAAIIAIVLIVAFRERLGLASEQKQKVASDSAPKIDSISALGRVEPASRIRRISPWGAARSSVITQLHVAQGDLVKAGQLLATLDTHNRLLADVQMAEASVVTAAARLKKIESGVDPALIEAKTIQLRAIESRIQLLKKELNRAKRLIQSKAISEEKIDRDQFQFDDAIHSKNRLTKELAAMSTVREVDRNVAAAELKSAQAALVMTRTLLKTSQLLAPISGTVLFVHAREGETIGERGILELADLSHMQVVAEVFEADIERIQLNMKARIRIVSGEHVYWGRVVEIGRLVGRQRVLSVDPVSDVDARVVEVRIDLDPEAVKALSGLSNARAEVFIGADIQGGGTKTRSGARR